MTIAEEGDKKVEDIKTTLFMDGHKALHCSGDDYRRKTTKFHDCFCTAPDEH